mmetsp:Transcript_46571/g.148682  ORF Transcript_46571/g.148682 Transcript_46571/m.148682 type:complete len:380 (+) Transcript_46571:729-1868(+)
MGNQGVLHSAVPGHHRCTSKTSSTRPPTSSLPASSTSRSARSAALTGPQEASAPAGAARIAARRPCTNASHTATPMPAPVGPMLSDTAALSPLACSRSSWCRTSAPSTLRTGASTSLTARSFEIETPRKHPSESTVATSPPLPFTSVAWPPSSLRGPKGHVTSCWKKSARPPGVLRGTSLCAALLGLMPAEATFTAAMLIAATTSFCGKRSKTKAYKFPETKGMTSLTPLTNRHPSCLGNSASRLLHIRISPDSAKRRRGCRCRHRLRRRFSAFVSTAAWDEMPAPMSEAASPTAAMGFTTLPAMPLPMPLAKPLTPPSWAPSTGFRTMSVSPPTPLASDLPASNTPTPTPSICFDFCRRFVLAVYCSSKVRLFSAADP